MTSFWVCRSGTRAAQAEQGAIGAGLVVAAVSNTCAMGTVLTKMPGNRRAGANLDAVLRAFS